ncbi:MAG: hypothetical protein Q8S14_09825 [Algoriphagus sp.]|uniref:hypothetical protein n=1 Tax=Algoriphagus sp. TaxID=1872435 RepID=UPI0027302A88|nr:hypothetical protein [Algoriphagus sp.]MDP2041797.1 hypothetical protein [Algoriphagus sp.]MDP3472160.1 hypothetical protein [Algoriphagus sp.]
MKGFRILASLIVLFIFHLNGFAQENKFDFQLSGGYLSQINTPKSASSVQYGGFVGIGVFKESKIGRLNIDLDLNYLSKHSPKELRINNYEGFSHKGQANYLLKFFPIGESHLFLGPGVAIHQPLKSSANFNGPSFGANGKVMAPVKLSGVLFYLTYDLDYLTGPGFWRNSVGISFRP